jgi:hypothetical protein
MYLLGRKGSGQDLPWMIRSVGVRGALTVARSSSDIRAQRISWSSNERHSTPQEFGVHARDDDVECSEHVGGLIDGQLEQIARWVFALRSSSAGRWCSGERHPRHDGGVRPLCPPAGASPGGSLRHPRAVEHVPRQPSTYASQLRAFTGAILRGEPVLTGPDDAVAKMA